VFKLRTKGPVGQPLWAYRYRLEGRDSERPQAGGFATRAGAEKALRKVPAQAHGDAAEHAGGAAASEGA